MPRTCAVCSRPLPESRNPHPARACSPDCRRADRSAYQRAWRAGGGVRVLTPALGAASALADLARQVTDPDVRMVVRRAAAWAAALE